MTENDYVENLRMLSVAKSSGWQYSDCPVVRTTTIETSKAWKQVVRETGEDEAKLYKKCELAIQAQARSRREDRERGQKPPQPKMLSAWLRAGRWDEQIESHVDRKSQKLSKCLYCDREVHGPNFDRCQYHLGVDEKGRLTHSFADEMRDYARRHPEVLKLKGKEAVEWIKDKLSRMVISG